MKKKQLDLKVRILYEPNRFSRDYLSDVYEKLKLLESYKAAIETSENNYAEESSKNKGVAK